MKHGIGPCLIAIAGQGRRQLRLGNGRGKGIAFYIGVIAQITYGGCPFAGQDHQRIGQRLTALIKVGGIVDAVAQVIQCRAKRYIGHRMALGLGAA